jgi:hypothetical protein
MVSAAPQAWYLPRIIQTNNASAAAVEKLAWDHAMDRKKQISPSQMGRSAGIAKISRAR